MTRAFIDLHCHTSASFDSLAKPADVARAARSRGLTHLVVSDHDRIDGALAARETAPEGLTVIVGEEVKTAEGDLICVFLERAIPPGLSAAETIAAAREQGGLVGIPHPFDRMRGSLLKDARMTALAPLVDWVETHNARLVGKGNEQAAEFAARSGAARRRRLGRALRPRGRRRLHRRGRRSLDARRAARRARERGTRPGPGELSRPPVDPRREGRPATPRERPDPPCGRGIRVVDRGSAMNGQDGQDHRRVAPDGYDPVGSDAMEISPGLNPAHPRPAKDEPPATPRAPPRATMRRSSPMPRNACP